MRLTVPSRHSVIFHALLNILLVIGFEPLQELKIVLVRATRQIHHVDSLGNSEPLKGSLQTFKVVRISTEDVSIKMKRSGFPLFQNCNKLSYWYGWALKLTRLRSTAFPGAMASKI